MKLKSPEILIIFLFIVGLIYFYFVSCPAFQCVFPKQSSESVAPATDSNQAEEQTYQFPDLTIPYLRQQSYDSQLADLEVLSEKTNYTEYLTQYDSDGFAINGLLTVPKGDEPEGGWPAIVFIHGYIPPTQYKTTERYESYVDYLARNGFVVFKIDLRGHGESQGEATGAYFSGSYVIDTLNAYSALENATFVNKEKIGLWGHSMAGNVVLRTLAVKQTIPSAVIWAGAVYTYQDMQDFGINDNSYRPPSQASERNLRREALFSANGLYSGASPYWQQVAPTNYLNDISAAIALHHAKNDSVVSIEYTRNLQQLLDATSIAHEVYEYETGGHDIEAPSFSTAMQRTLEFYQQNM